MVREIVRGRMSRELDHDAAKRVESVGFIAGQGNEVCYYGLLYYQLDICCKE
jgi:hypothetical protein